MVCERIGPKGRRRSVPLKRPTGGTELQKKTGPKDVTTVRIQMEHTVNGEQRRNGSRSIGTRGEVI